jgi:hypothetical protein
MITEEPNEQDITRVCRTASQLYGDLIRLLNVQPDSAIEQQALQLILDSYESVGLMAMEVKSRYMDQPCRCGEYETCSACVEAHRQFQQARHGQEIPPTT